MDCEAIYTFDNGEQAFSECAEIDLDSKTQAKQSIELLLARNKETRKIVKASIAIILAGDKGKIEKTAKLKWFFDCNGKLFW